MRHRDAGLPRQDLAELHELAVERGIERAGERELDGPRAASAGVWAWLMSANHGRDAAVSIRPGQSAMTSLRSARSAARRSRATARTAATWATLEGMFSQLP